MDKKEIACHIHLNEEHQKNRKRIACTVYLNDEDKSNTFSGFGEKSTKVNFWLSPLVDSKLELIINDEGEFEFYVIKGENKERLSSGAI